jgi:hypothetical protein
MHVEIMPVEVLGVGLGVVDVCPSLGMSRAGSVETVDSNEDYCNTVYLTKDNSFIF